MYYSVMRSCVAVMLSLATLTAFASELKQVPLPTDPSISVAVGISGRWKSNVEKGPSRFRLYSADLSTYCLDETATLSNLLEHEFATSPHPTSRFWYSFYSVDDHIFLHINITSSSKKLGRLEVRSIVNNELLKTLSGVMRNTRFYDTFEADPDISHYRLDGFNTDGTKIFSIGASMGDPRGLGYVKVVRYFEPKVRFVGKPYIHPESDDQNPFRVVLSDVPLYTRLAYLNHVANNSSSPQKYRPLKNTFLPLKRWFFGNPNGIFGRYVSPPDIVDPSDPVSPSLTKEWDETAIELSAYSDNIIKFDFQIYGTMQAYVAMPYRLWRNPIFRERIRGVFEKIAKSEPLCIPGCKDNWYRLYKEWLKTNEGKSSGLEPEMVNGVFACACEDAKLAKTSGS